MDVAGIDDDDPPAVVMDAAAAAVPVMEEEDDDDEDGKPCGTGLAAEDANPAPLAGADGCSNLIRLSSLSCVLRALGKALFNFAGGLMEG